MARKRFEKGTEMFEMFMDFWKIVQDFWIVEENDEYWQSLVDCLNHFANKYGNKQFPRALALALSNELERKKKEGD